MKMRLAALLALAGIMTSASAQASCWRAEEAEAAAIRDFQTMLMVSTLRCRAAGLGSSVGYDVFVLANRTLLDATNATIRAHFAADTEATSAQERYDRFTTLLANGYGAGATTPRSCAAAAELTTIATAAAGSREAMLRVVATRTGQVVEACRPERIAAEESAFPGQAEAPRTAAGTGGGVRLAFAIPN